jgi:hypothetical protein
MSNYRITAAVYFDCTQKLFDNDNACFEFVIERRRFQLHNRFNCFPFKGFSTISLLLGWNEFLHLLSVSSGDRLKVKGKVDGGEVERAVEIGSAR